MTPTLKQPNTLAFPTDIFLGKLETEKAEIGLFAQAIWIISLVASPALWRGGVPRLGTFGI